MAHGKERYLFGLFATVLFALHPTAAIHAGDLNSVREAVDEEEDQDKKTKRPRKTSHRNSDPYCDDSDSRFTSILIADLLGPPLLFTVSAPWWVPASLMGDDYTQLAEFPRYPYQDDQPGYLVFDPDESIASNGLGLRFTSEYSNDFSGLERIGGRLQMETISRFGIDTEWNYWREEIAGGHDSLWTGDTNLIYRFAQSEQIQFYTGLGLNWLGGTESDVGFNFTYGFDWFPADPVVLRTVIDAGTLGDADLYHFKTTAGVVYHHFEFFAGYDILHIGDTNLQGFIGGLTLWW